MRSFWSVVTVVLAIAVLAYLGLLGAFLSVVTGEPW